MSVWAFNSLSKGKDSNLFIVAVFSSKSFFGKTSLVVKKPYLVTFPDDKSKILAACLLNHIEFCFARFCYRLF